ncbi:MAG: hypothetical protein ACREHD_22990, partial [Pirellulales bacterium]
DERRDSDGAWDPAGQFYFSYYYSLGIYYATFVGLPGTQTQVARFFDLATNNALQATSGSFFSPLGYTNDWIQNRGSVVTTAVSYGANIDFYADVAPRATAVIIDASAGSAHIVDQPAVSGPPVAAQVYDLYSGGPLYVAGNGATRVVIGSGALLDGSPLDMPNQDSVQQLLSASLTLFNTPQILHDILADVDVSNSSLVLEDRPGALPGDEFEGNVVLTSDTLTGMTGGAIHFQTLTSLQVVFSQAGADVQVQDTPAGITTTLDFLAAPATAGNSSVSIQATTGALLVLGVETADLGADGSLQNLHGAVTVYGDNNADLVIDDSADPAARQAALTGPDADNLVVSHVEGPDFPLASFPLSFNAYTLTGLAPALLQFNSPFYSSSEIHIGPSTSLNVGVNLLNMKVFGAGPASAVSLGVTSQWQQSALEVIGAGQGYIADPAFAFSVPIVFVDDPSRPKDPFKLTLDVASGLN